LTEEEIFGRGRGFLKEGFELLSPLLHGREGVRRFLRIANFEKMISSFISTTAWVVIKG